MSLMSPALVAGFFTISATWEAHFLLKLEIIQGLLHFPLSTSSPNVSLNPLAKSYFREYTCGLGTAGIKDAIKLTSAPGHVNLKWPER